MYQKKREYDTYDKRTIDSPNPFARFSHRSRVDKGYSMVLTRLSEGKWLDYGCGSGALINRVINSPANSGGGVYGYEPFMVDRNAEELPIFSDYGEIVKLAPFATITVFEVFEHLQWKEIFVALNRFKDILEKNGRVYVSVPIEVGPALILKEINRKRTEDGFRYKFFEFMGAVFLGIPGYRENPDSDYMSHKGFDFRHLIRFAESKGWKVKILGYGPLPIPTWYGNSQVFLRLTLCGTEGHT